MFINIDKSPIFYQTFGSTQNPVLILLHGWGQNSGMMTPLAKKFLNNYYVISLDLPGFGQSPSPSTIRNVEDYADMLNNFLKKLHIQAPIIIGHSFGGRIALLYASKYSAKTIILIASPFRPEKINFLDRSLIYLTKKINKFPLLKNIIPKLKNFFGSEDYKNASPVMRQILVKTVSQDLSPFFKKINCPVLIIWGAKDTTVPVSESEILHQELSKFTFSHLEIIPHTGHFVYLEKLNQVSTLINNFLKKSPHASR